jgi:hypothetical protein
MGRTKELVDEEYLQTIERLLTDPNSSVRSRAFYFLWNLFECERDFVIAKLSLATVTEPSELVLSQMVNSFYVLCGMEPDCILRLTRCVWHRIRYTESAKDGRHGCMGIFLGLALGRNMTSGTNTLHYINHRIVSFIDDIQFLLANLSEGLALRFQPEGFNRAEMQNNTIDFALQVVTHVEDEFAKLSESNFGDKELTRALASCSMNLALSISNALDLFRQDQETFAQNTTELLLKLSPVIETLARLGFPETVHYIIDTLSPVVELLPEQILIWIAEFAKSAEKFGYQNDRLAADQIIALLHRYLADFRHIFQEQVECRDALLDILDTIVGWPESRTLVHRLDEVFN